MNIQEFTTLLNPVTDTIAGQPVDRKLEDRLNREFAPNSSAFREIEAACCAATDAGWMCAEGGGNRRFGRVVEPTPVTHDLSIDVVDMTDMRGGHHAHPAGEVLMIMPQDASA